MALVPNAYSYKMHQAVYESKEYSRGPNKHVEPWHTIAQISHAPFAEIASRHIWNYPFNYINEANPSRVTENIRQGTMAWHIDARFMVAGSSMASVLVLLFKVI